jgi:hypothetical protein
VASNRIAWLGGAALGAVALARALTRRPPPPPVQAPPRPPEAEPSGPDPRAEELRARLADARELADERDEFEGAETPVDEAEPVADPEARRRAVHDSGRSAAERMRSSRPD